MGETRVVSLSGANANVSVPRRMSRDPQQKTKVMPFAVTSNVHVEWASNGIARQLRHIQSPYRAADLSGRSLVTQYVQEVAEIYQLPPYALTTLNNQFYATN